MSRELLNVNETSTIKEGDDSTTLILSAHDNNEPATFGAGDIGTIKITTDDAKMPDIPAKLIVGSNNIDINSADLANLPAGKYHLELWVAQNGGPKHTIYPSDGSLDLTIDKSADDLTGKKLTTLTIDDFRKDLHKDVEDAVKQIKVDPSDLDLSDYVKKENLPKVPVIKLDATKRTLNIDGNEISIPENIDLSGYAKTNEIPNVKYDASTKTLTVDGQNVEIPATVDLSNYYTKPEVDQAIKDNKPTIDLTDYVKREDLADYAKKSELPTVPAITLDTQARTLTINNQSINIPNTVDLSGYATKSELPHVTLDVSKRQISVGDTTLDVPSEVDLSGYYTKSEVDAELANAAAGGKVDLSGYVKVTDLKNYALKSDIPEVPDLSGYAKKSDIKEVDLTPYLKVTDADQKYAVKEEVPSVVYDAAKKTLTVNGVVVTLPETVDLSDYVRKEDTEDFATKSELPKVQSIKLDTTKRTLSVDGQEISIPGNVDLTGYVKTGELAEYAKKSELPTVPSIALDTTNRTLTINSQAINIPESVDLSGYAKKNEVPDVKYDAVARTLTINGQVVEIPATVDLSDYARKEDLTGLAKKSDIPNIPDLSKYALKSDVKSVDLTPYLKIADAEQKYATKDDLNNVQSKAGQPGTQVFTYSGSIASDWDAYKKINNYKIYSSNFDQIVPKINSDSSNIRNGDLIIASLSNSSNRRFELFLAKYVSIAEIDLTQLGIMVTGEPGTSGSAGVRVAESCSLLSTNEDGSVDSAVFNVSDIKEAKSLGEFNIGDVIFDESNGIFVKVTGKNYQNKTISCSGINLKGSNGKPGKDGKDGESAYQIAQDHGFKGTEEEWLASLKGKDGKDGSSSSSINPPLAMQFKNVKPFAPFNLTVIPTQMIAYELGADLNNPLTLTPKTRTWLSSGSGKTGTMLPGIYFLGSNSTLPDNKKVTVNMNNGTVDDAREVIITPSLSVVVTSKNLYAITEGFDIIDDTNYSSTSEWKQII